MCFKQQTGCKITEKHSNAISAHGLYETRFYEAHRSPWDIGEHHEKEDDEIYAIDWNS